MKTRDVKPFALIAILFLTSDLAAQEVWYTQSPAHTLISVSRSQKRTVEDSAILTLPAVTAANSIQPLPAQVSVFWPTAGESQFGQCWIGLTIDSNDNLYPINPSGVFKVLPSGTLVNGVNDQNYFASPARGFYAVLDESNGKFYSPAVRDVFQAAFGEGSAFSSLISGLTDGRGVALGQGSLSGSLFVVDGIAKQVFRITVSPLQLSVFFNGTSFLDSPETISSAPDGALYVVDIGTNPTQLIKIAPSGTPSVFAIAPDPTINNINPNLAVIVDASGNVYWSHARGINKFNSSGNLIGMLPGPPDKQEYGVPSGAVFDSQGNLYVVDSRECKKIYKYTLGQTELSVIARTAGQFIANNDPSPSASVR